MKPPAPVTSTRVPGGGFDFFGSVTMVLNEINGNSNPNLPSGAVKTLKRDHRPVSFGLSTCLDRETVGVLGFENVGHPTDAGLILWTMYRQLVTYREVFGPPSGV